MFTEKQLDILDVKTSYVYIIGKSIPSFPLWNMQLYWYELEQIYPSYKNRHKERSKISLAGTINPNPNKYRMVEMTDFKLKGFATMEELVEVEITDAETPEEAKTIAEKEVLMTHPEYVDVDFFEVKNAD